MYRCAICGEEFSNLKALAVHLRQHVYQDYGVCPVCGYRYSRWKSFLMHLSGRQDLAHVQLAWAVVNKSNKNRSAWRALWLELETV